MGQDKNMEPMYVSSIVDLIISILISLVAIFINWKFLKDMNADDKERAPNSNGIIIKDVMTTNTKTGMIFLPTVLILHWFLNEDYFELPTWIQYSFCYLTVIAKCFRIYFGFI